MLRRALAAVVLSWVVPLGALRAEPPKEAPSFAADLAVLEDASAGKDARLAVLRRWEVSSTRLRKFVAEQPRALGVLVKTTYDQETDVGSAARAVLPPLGAVAVAPLLTLLKDPKNGWAAIQPLGRLGPVAKEAIPALLEIAVRPDSSIGTAGDAITALSSIALAPEPLLAPLDEAWRKRDERPRISETGISHPFPTTEYEKLVVRAGAASAPLLVTWLESGVPSRVAAALEALPKLGPAAAPAVTSLAKLLKAPKDARQRRDLVIALLSIGPAAASALPVLLEVLADGTDGVASLQVALLLSRLGPAAAPAVPILRARLKEGKPSQRVDYLRALASLGPASKEALEDVVPLVDSPSPEAARESYAAAAVVAAIDPAHPKGFPHLLDGVRKGIEAASDALERMTAYNRPAHAELARIAAGADVPAARAKAARVLLYSKPDAGTRDAALTILAAGGEQAKLGVALLIVMEPAPTDALPAVLKPLGAGVDVLDAQGYLQAAARMAPLDAEGLKLVSQYLDAGIGWAGIWSALAVLKTDRSHERAREVLIGSLPRLIAKSEAQWAEFERTMFATVACDAALLLGPDALPLAPLLRFTAETTHDERLRAAARAALASVTR